MTIKIPTKKYEKIVANAAPLIPNNGIRKIFKKTFRATEENKAQKLNTCFPRVKYKELMNL